MPYVGYQDRLFHCMKAITYCGMVFYYTQSPSDCCTHRLSFVTRAEKEKKIKEERTLNIKKFGYFQKTI